MLSPLEKDENRIIDKTVAKNYVDSYFNRSKSLESPLEEGSCLEYVRELTEEDRIKLYERMYLLHKMINKSAKWLFENNRLIVFDYVNNDFFYSALYEKLYKTFVLVMDYVSMIDQAQNGWRPYEDLTTSLSEELSHVEIKDDILKEEKY